MFWIFFAVVWAGEVYLYSKGHNTMFFAHKTPAEKAIRRKQTGIGEEGDEKV